MFFQQKIKVQDTPSLSFPFSNFHKIPPAPQEHTQVCWVAGRRVTVPAEPGAGSPACVCSWGLADLSPRAKGDRDGCQTCFGDAPALTMRVMGKVKHLRPPPVKTFFQVLAPWSPSAMLGKEKKKSLGETLYFPHQQEEFSRLKQKSNFPDSKAKSDATCPSARQCRSRLRGGKACVRAQPQLRWEAVISMPLSTVFNSFKRYLYISLSLPVVTLAHSSLTMYQESTLCEKGGYR